MHIKVRVKTGAKNESIKQIVVPHQNTEVQPPYLAFEVSVREKPEANMANKRVLALMAKALKIPAARIRITKGHHSPSKILSIDSHS